VIQNGLGTHTWDSDVATIEKIFQIFWIDETFYILILMLTKASILLFYMRIFPTTGFQYAAKGLLGFVLLSGTTILFVQLFQCMPIRFNWDKDVKGHCINVNALTYAHGAINIFQDVLILALPIPWVLALKKLATSQKIGLVIMFQLGAFACVTSAVRLRFLFAFGGTNSIDPLWENSNATMWTSAETASAIVCACLPAMRALWKTGRQKANEYSSKRKSVTNKSQSKSGGGGVLFSNSSKRTASTAEEFHLGLVETWEQKDAEAGHRGAPITISQTDLGASSNDPKTKKGFMPSLHEVPEPARSPPKSKPQPRPPNHTPSSSWHMAPTPSHAEPVSHYSSDFDGALTPPMAGKNSMPMPKSHHATAASWSNSSVSVGSPTGIGTHMPIRTVPQFQRPQGSWSPVTGGVSPQLR
jgi:hypothetical protein